jgi:hypothetical protein
MITDSRQRGVLTTEYATIGRAQTVIAAPGTIALIAAPGGDLHIRVTSLWAVYKTVAGGSVDWAYGFETDFGATLIPNRLYDTNTQLYTWPHGYESTRSERFFVAVSALTGAGSLQISVSYCLIGNTTVNPP